MLIPIDDQSRDGFFLETEGLSNRRHSNPGPEISTDNDVGRPACQKSDLVTLASSNPPPTRHPNQAAGISSCYDLNLVRIKREVLADDPVVDWLSDILLDTIVEFFFFMPTFSLG